MLYGYFSAAVDNFTSLPCFTVTVAMMWVQCTNHGVCRLVPVLLSEVGEWGILNRLVIPDALP